MKQKSDVLTHPVLFRPKRVTFSFEFEDGTKDFHYVVDAELQYRPDRPPEHIPEWAELPCHRCSCCTLAETCRYCPPALRLSDLVSRFSNSSCIERVVLRRAVGGEEHSITTDLQRALAFVFPAIVARSACPHARFLHVVEKYCKPFPDLQDVMFYSVAFELIGHWINSAKEPSQTADTSMAHLGASAKMESVFHGLMNRLRVASPSDVNLNAIVMDLQWSYVPLYSRKLLLHHVSRLFCDGSFSQTEVPAQSVERELEPFRRRRTELTRLHARFGQQT